MAFFTGTSGTSKAPFVHWHPSKCMPYKKWSVTICRGSRVSSRGSRVKCRGSRVKCRRSQKTSRVPKKSRFSRAVRDWTGLPVTRQAVKCNSTDTMSQCQCAVIVLQIWFLFKVLFLLLLVVFTNGKFIFYLNDHIFIATPTHYVEAFARFLRSGSRIFEESLTGN